MSDKNVCSEIRYKNKSKDIGHFVSLNLLI